MVAECRLSSSRTKRICTEAKGRSRTQLLKPIDPIAKPYPQFGIGMLSEDLWINHLPSGRCCPKGWSINHRLREQATEA